MPHILIIDNDRSVGAAMEYMLRNAGHSSIYAPDALAGIEALDKADFDLVFVDMLMPGMNGVETIRRIQARKPDLPIVAMTGFRLRSAALDSSDLLATAENIGAATSLRKPFTQEELLAAANLPRIMQAVESGNRL